MLWPLVAGIAIADVRVVRRGSIRQRQSQIQPLHPEIGGRATEVEVGASVVGIARRFGNEANLTVVHGAIESLGGPDDTAEPKDVVTEREAAIRSDVVPYVQSELTGCGELVPCEATAV
jgi:hypothetical protein